MKIKKDEDKLLWEAYIGGNPMEDAEDDFMDDEIGDEFSDDEFEDDGMGMEPDMDPNSMVMEIDPVAPVESHEVNEELVSQLKKLAEFGKRLYDMKDSADFEDWMVSAVTVAATYVSDVWFRLDAKADYANTGFEQVDDYEQF